VIGECPQLAMQLHPAHPLNKILAFVS
jgi:hypothetical protein